MTVPAFQIHSADNVATLLQDVEQGTLVEVRGDATVQEVRARQSIRIGHKVALHDLPAGTHVIKYSFPIGVTTLTVAKGEWVHLHNCRSLHDSRSLDLSVEAGSRDETRYA
jgi:altronate dehydratase small subunit